MCFWFLCKNENTKGDNGMKAPVSRTRDPSAAKSKDAPASHKPTRGAWPPLPVIPQNEGRGKRSRIPKFWVQAEFKREFKTYAASMT